MSVKEILIFNLLKPSNIKATFVLEAVVFVD